MASDALDIQTVAANAVQTQVRLFRRPVSRKALRLAAAAFATALFVGVTPALAQDESDPSATVGQSFLAPRQFVGVARTDGTIVRGGPAAGELAVASLPQGAEVTVIARQGDFLRILPPDDTFCLVPKSRVNVRGAVGEGTQTGRVSEGLSVRVGSSLSDGVGSTAQRLRAGDVVRVVGEQGNYYRIEPPKMVFFYVAINEMSKGREVAVTETPVGWAVADLPEEVDEASAELAARTTVDAVMQDEPEAPALQEPEVEEQAQAEIVVADEAPDVELPDEAPAVELPPAPPVAVATAEVMATFESLDARYTEGAELPLEDQPLDELEADYAALVAKAGEAGDPASLNLVPVIEARLKTIQIRRDALADLAEIRQMQASVEDRRTALEAERAELAERVEAGRIQVYEAVGELQTSSLQTRGGTLFRLVDPVSKHTIIYARATGDEAAALAGRLTRFIGIRGEVIEDELLKLKYVRVTESQLVDPSEVFDNVAAKLIPPSLTRPDAVAATN